MILFASECSSKTNTFYTKTITTKNRKALTHVFEELKRTHKRRRRNDPEVYSVSRLFENRPRDINTVVDYNTIVSFAKRNSRQRNEIQGHECGELLDMILILDQIRNKESYRIKYTFNNKRKTQ